MTIEIDIFVNTTKLQSIVGYTRFNSFKHLITIRDGRIKIRIFCLSQIHPIILYFRTNQTVGEYTANFMLVISHIRKRMK